MDALHSLVHCRESRKYMIQFKWQFPEGTLEARTEDSSGDAYMESIDLSNRYLTPASEAGRLNSVPFQPGVDPKGILQCMA